MRHSHKILETRVVTKKLFPGLLLIYYISKRGLRRRNLPSPPPFLSHPLLQIIPKKEIIDTIELIYERGLRLENLP